MWKCKKEALMTYHHVIFASARTLLPQHTPPNQPHPNMKQLEKTYTVRTEPQARQQSKKYTLRHGLRNRRPHPKHGSMALVPQDKMPNIFFETVLNFKLCICIFFGMFFFSRRSSFQMRIWNWNQRNNETTRWSPGSLSGPAAQWMFLKASGNGKSSILRDVFFVLNPPWIGLCSATFDYLKG